ncbi:MAG: helix-turn-helix transcriptional regulator [Rickettsiales bacterium]|nr:helix-turn-helix transcriptional regulator [Rickettsiales bacterium]
MKNNTPNKVLAERLNIAKAYLSSILNGRIRPSGVIISRIIDLTHAEVTADTFFREQISKYKTPTYQQPPKELSNEH